MSFATGMSWLKHWRDYELKFGKEVPDWVSIYDLHARPPLVITAIRLGWRLLEQVLVRDEFQQGLLSLLGTIVFVNKVSSGEKS